MKAIGSEVLSRWNDVPEIGDVVIEKVMVERIRNVLEDSVKILEIHHHPRAGIKVALDVSFQHVIMAVAVFRIGRSIQFSIFVLA